MKAAVACVLLVLVLVSGAQAQETPAKHITVDATIEAVRVTNGRLRVGDFRAEVLFLWQPGNPAPIGTQYVYCRYLGRGGLLGSGIWWCNAEAVMPLGKIRASGRRKGPRYYSWPITLGTGAYEGARGTFTIRPNLPGRLKLVVAYR